MYFIKKPNARRVVPFMMLERKKEKESEREEDKGRKEGRENRRKEGRIAYWRIYDVGQNSHFPKSVL